MKFTVVRGISPGPNISGDNDVSWRACLHTVSRFTSFTPQCQHILMSLSE